MRNLRLRDLPKDVQPTNTGTNFRESFSAQRSWTWGLYLQEKDHIRKSSDPWVQRLVVPFLKPASLSPLDLTGEQSWSTTMLA